VLLAGARTAAARCGTHRAPNRIRVPKFATNVRNLRASGWRPRRSRNRQTAGVSASLEGFRSTTEIVVSPVRVRVSPSRSPSERQLRGSGPASAACHVVLRTVLPVRLCAPANPRRRSCSGCGRRERNSPRPVPLERSALLLCGDRPGGPGKALPMDEGESSRLDRRAAAARHRDEIVRRKRQSSRFAGTDQSLTMRSIASREVTGSSAPRPRPAAFDVRRRSCAAPTQISGTVSTWGDRCAWL
jgi:hypothetical protein